MDPRSTKKEGATARHCAYCLQLCAFPAQLCGGCKKRAYCSKECQTTDWSSKGNGQRHVNWCCRHEYGEEDVDWEVVPILNKGLGIRAKKLIPAGLKIIVEPTFSSPDAHQGVKDLGPDGVTLNQKFTKNIFWGGYYGETGCKPTVALRIARVNHSCQPNAATIYDETARVAILFAQKDIQPGEEICICYYFPFFWLAPDSTDPDSMSNEEEEFSFWKNQLASKYGIICSSNCSCYDPAFRALTLEGRQLYDATKALSYQLDIVEALEAGDKLLDIYRRLNVSWESLGRMNYLLFEIAIWKSETLTKATEYIRSAYDLYRKICPYSEKYTKKYKKLLEHPEEHPNYLLIG